LHDRKIVKSTTALTREAEPISSVSWTYPASEWY